MRKPGTADAADDRRSMAGVLVFMGSPPAMQARKADGACGITALPLERKFSKGATRFAPYFFLQ
jgi:hypothetical protein